MTTQTKIKQEDTGSYRDVDSGPVNEIPPFSVFDARAGAWQKRKRQWLGLGIRSELGRGDGEQIKSIHMGLDYGEKNQKTNKLAPGKTGRGSIYTDPKKYQRKEGETIPESDLSITSIFDPVLCELSYRWFCKPKGRILDPFAGGVVRGIVASKLGMKYTGIDLRQEQVANNDEQAELILGPSDEMPVWIVGDSMSDIPNGWYDFVLTCPPYFDLEQYSEDPGDLSNKGSYSSFLKAYNGINGEVARHLDSNRFAVYVVGNLRTKSGDVIDFVGDTIRSMRQQGLRLHNDAILVTPAGSLPMRAARNFPAGRRLGRTHQHVLVFVKGDAEEAVAKIPMDMRTIPMWMQTTLDLDVSPL